MDTMELVTAFLARYEGSAGSECGFEREVNAVKDFTIEQMYDLARTFQAYSEGILFHIDHLEAAELKK
jgi:hypothetical protein